MFKWYLIYILCEEKLQMIRTQMEEKEAENVLHITARYLTAIDEKGRNISECYFTLRVSTHVNKWN